jgi:hypothetical protein
MTNRVRHSKQRLASKQLVQAVHTPTSDDTQPVGTWLNPAPPSSIVKHYSSVFVYSDLSFL